VKRTEYHRAYYWRRLSERRASARASRRKARTVAAIIKIVCEAVTEARNDKPPFGGLTMPGVGITLGLRFKRDGSLKDCSSPVNHPTTPNSSGSLDGETTRRESLNPHRGGQPVGAQRVVGKRKWQSEQSDEK
jgi:hypothetical protein